ncbi:unnamed protein product [Arctia plantaginis]|uniref:Uncharacterized protein n=1 Tax=Arctia plantaginis TaxID=874455 RepID=A0A8S1BIK9_ARCPL|nr:unnamed protein product [Arctia plantaginis]
MSDSNRLKPHAISGTDSRGTRYTLERKSLVPRHTSGHLQQQVDDPPPPVWEPHVPSAPWKRARFATRSPPPRPASARVTDGVM